MNKTSHKDLEIEVQYGAYVIGLTDRTKYEVNDRYPFYLLVQLLDFTEEFWVEIEGSN